MSIIDRSHNQMVKEEMTKVTQLETINQFQHDIMV